MHVVKSVEGLLAAIQAFTDLCSQMMNCQLVLSEMVLRSIDLFFWDLRCCRLAYRDRIEQLCHFKEITVLILQFKPAIVVDI